MPKYVFECPNCDLQFTRALKMGEHPDHPCPSCGTKAPRQWNGNGFGFDFSRGVTPGNSGVTKQDYPTADQAVGRSAEERWMELRARDEIKDKVREVSGHHALRRVNDPKGKHIEYQAGGQALVEHRKELAKGVNARLMAEVESNR